MIRSCCRLTVTLLVMLLLFAAGGCALVDRMSGEDEARRIRAGGIPATARVLAISDTGVTVNDNPVVGFDLEVRPDSAEAYRASTRALISRLHIPLIQAGAVLPVAIDPLDRSKVALAIYDDPP